MTPITKRQSAPGSTGAQASQGKRQHQKNYTPLQWFFKQGARFVRVAAWNAKVNSPGKQPIDKAWQVKPITLKDIMPHVNSGGNVGLLCGSQSDRLCLLDVDDHLQEFLEYFPGLAACADGPTSGCTEPRQVGYQDHRLDPEKSEVEQSTS